MFLLAAGCLHAAPKPNLVIILADDMGYSDPGCFGGEIHTPALDRLASEGLRLTRFHNGGMCVVSRASMLTGNWWPNALPNSRRRHSCPRNCMPPVIAPRSSANGISPATRWIAGSTTSSGSSMDSPIISKVRKAIESIVNLSRISVRTTTAAIASPTVRSISSPADRAGRTNRFFLYLSYQAPHNPLQARKPDIMKTRGKYLAGWQAVREAQVPPPEKNGAHSCKCHASGLPGEPSRLEHPNTANNAISKTSGCRSTRRWSNAWTMESDVCSRPLRKAARRTTP